MEDLIRFVPVAIVVGIVILLFIMGYKKAPADKAIVITGMRKAPKYLIGKAGLRIPFLERADDLYLKQVTVNVEPKRIPTKDFINVDPCAVFKVQICTKDKTRLDRAAVNFLNKSPKQIIIDIEDALAGNLREVVGTMLLVELIQEKDKFSEALVNAAGSDMANLGLEIVTCNITNISDENNAIIDLGAANLAAIKREAQINEANAHRDVEVAKAKADQESNEARIVSDTAIETQNQGFAVERARLKAVTEKEEAIAEAQRQIEAEKQRTSVEEATVNADIRRAERQSELLEKEILNEEKRLDADVRKKADADRYQREQAAGAARVEQEEQAKARRIAQEEEAKGIEAMGRARALARELEGKAEATAILERAEAMKQFGQAANLEMLIKVLPDMAREIAAPLTAISDVKIITGNADTVSGVSGQVSNVMAQIFESTKLATGIDPAEVVRAETFEGKVTKNINLTGIVPGTDVTIDDVTVTAPIVEVAEVESVVVEND